MTPNSIQWYDNGVFGKNGYACPFFEQKNQYTNNIGIWNLHATFGKLLLGINAQPDVWKTTPPENAYWPKLVGKSIDRIRATVLGALVTTGQTDTRSVTLGTDPKPFILYPVPYFRLRNPWAKQWTYYSLMALAEIMRLSNNLDSININSLLAGTINQYTNQIYQELAINLLGKQVSDIVKAGGIQSFQLTDADYAAYNPDATFAAIEKVDTGATLDLMLSPNDLGPIIEGIPAPVIVPFLKNWPTAYVPTPDTTSQAAGAQAGDAVTAPPAGVSSAPAQIVKPGP